MPSFVGHSVFGLAIDRLLPRGGKRGFLSALVLSNAADLDYFPKLLSEKSGLPPVRTSHSLAWALGIGTMNGIVSSQTRRRFLPSFVRGAALYSSHLLLDLLSKESPGGIPLFWPLTTRRYALQWTFFVTIRSRRRSGFLKVLLNRNNAYAVKRELAITLPTLSMAVLIRRLID